MKLPTFALAMTLFFPLFAAAADASTGGGSSQTESLVVGTGCFWCSEAAYQLVPGVKHVTSGYAGGTTPNPSYEQVCTGETGHAEVVKIDFDPTQTSVEKLLNFFWTIHDPTSLNKQGADEGTQYRSIILYSDEHQKEAAEKSKAAAQADFKEPIVTQIEPLKTFYPAEAYHQDYYKNHPYQGYCQFVIRPKIAKAKKTLGVKE
jgi:peptide-methionine (S)-S-oxide reductase